MRDSHGGGGFVASLYAAVLAEGDVEALVNKRLVGIVVVGQQSLLELALVPKDSLSERKHRLASLQTQGGHHSIGAGST